MRTVLEQAVEPIQGRKQMFDIYMTSIGLLVAEVLNVIVGAPAPLLSLEINTASILQTPLPWSQHLNPNLKALSCTSTAGVVLQRL